VAARRFFFTTALTPPERGHQLSPTRVHVNFAAMRPKNITETVRYGICTASEKQFGPISWIVVQNQAPPSQRGRRRFILREPVKVRMNLAPPPLRRPTTMMTLVRALTGRLAFDRRRGAIIMPNIFGFFAWMGMLPGQRERFLFEQIELHVGHADGFLVGFQMDDSADKEAASEIVNPQAANGAALAGRLSLQLTGWLNGRN